MTLAAHIRLLAADTQRQAPHPSQVWDLWVWACAEDRADVAVCLVGAALTLGTRRGWRRWMRRACAVAGGGAIATRRWVVDRTWDGTRLAGIQSGVALRTMMDAADRMHLAGGEPDRAYLSPALYATLQTCMPNYLARLTGVTGS